MLKFFLIPFSFLTFMTSGAQIKHMFDSIRYDFKQDKRMYFGLDGKNTVISDFPIKMFGLQLGYLYNKRTALYMGYYASYNDDVQTKNPTAGIGKTDSNTVNQKVQLNYLNIGIEYAFFDSKRWRLSIPLAIGLGSGYRRQYSPFKTISESKNPVSPLELGFNAKYKLKWWLWIGAGIGTRLSFSSSNFNGSVYSFGISLKTGEMYRRFKKWYKAK